MPFYEVTVRDVRTPTSTRSIAFESASSEVAKQAAVTSRWEAVSVRQLPGKPASVRVARVKRIGGKPLVQLCKALGSMVRNGVPLTDALYFYADGEADPGIKSALNSIRTRIKDGGEDAGDAFAASGRFDEVFVGIVKAGSKGGILGEALRGVAAHVETQTNLQGRLRRALFQPLISIGLIFFIFIFAQLRLIPSIEKTVNDTRLPPDAFSKFVFAVSHVIQATWPLIIGGVTAAVCSMIFSMRVRNAVNERLMSCWPLFRKMWSGFNQLLVLSTMEMLISNKIGVVEAIRAASRVMAKQPMGPQLSDIAMRYQSGSISLGEGLSKYTSCDRLVAHMIKAGEQTGTLEPQLQNLVATYKESVSDSVDSFLNSASLVAIIIASTLISFVFLSSMLPVISLGPRLMESGARH